MLHMTMEIGRERVYVETMCGKPGCLVHSVTYCLIGGEE